MVVEFAEECVGSFGFWDFFLDGNWDRIVVVIAVVVLRVRLRVWVLEKLKECFVVGFVLGEVEVRGKRVK